MQNAGRIVKAARSGASEAGRGSAVAGQGEAAPGSATPLVAAPRAAPRIQVRNAATFGRAALASAAFVAFAHPGSNECCLRFSDFTVFRVC